MNDVSLISNVTARNDEASVSKALANEVVSETPSANLAGIPIEKIDPAQDPQHAWKSWLKNWASEKKAYFQNLIAQCGATISSVISYFIGNTASDNDVENEIAQRTKCFEELTTLITAPASLNLDEKALLTQSQTNENDYHSRWHGKNGGAFVHASCAISSVPTYCEKAADENISENEKMAWCLAAHYRLKSTELWLENWSKGIRSAWPDITAADAAKNAATYFHNADQKDGSANAKTAWRVAAHSKLQEAELRDSGNLEASTKFKKIAEALALSAEYFEKDDDEKISEHEKTAWRSAADYSLQAAQNLAHGNSESVEKFERAAASCSRAANYFHNANEENLPADKKEKWTLAGEFMLKAARARAQGHWWSAGRFFAKAWNIAERLEDEEASG